MSYTQPTRRYEPRPDPDGWNVYRNGRIFLRFETQSGAETFAAAMNADEPEAVL